jgi:nucleoside-diphosphate-sugar epimerase
VTVLDLKEPKATGVNFVRGNITNKAVCEKACENVDIVFHAAAASVFGTEAELWENNVIATRMLLEVAEAAGVKHFVFSSCTE